MATAEKEMTDAKSKAATAPTPSNGRDGSAIVSQEEQDRRFAAGLPSPFDPDDDDLDENMEEVDPSAEKKPTGDEPEEKNDAEAKEAEADDKKEKVEEKVEAEKEVDSALAALQERAKIYKLDTTKFSDQASLEAGIEAMELMFAAKGEAILEAEEEAHGKGDEAKAEAAPVETEAEADSDDKKKPEPKKFDDKGKKVEFKLDKLSREEYAPELLDAFDEIKNTLLEEREQNRRFRDSVAAEKARIQTERREAEAAESTRRIDAKFAAKAKESPVWAELFGTASGRELLKTAEGKKQFENRQKAIRSGDAYLAGLEASKLPPPDFDASFDTGLAIAFRDKLAEAAKKQVAEKVNARRNSDIPRPSSSRSATPKGSALRATLKKHGMSPDADG
jgi:hypothetical protein